MAFVGGCLSSETGASSMRHRRTVAATLPCMVSRSSAAATLAAAAVVILSSADSADATGIKNGRLEACRAEQNCISTASVRNPSKFGPPTSDPAEAWQTLVQVVEQTPKANVVEKTDSYVRAEFPAFPRGLDDVEFLLNTKENIVSYRSCSREVIFVYPLQQPIGDLGRNVKRLEGIRDRLGWQSLGGT